MITRPLTRTELAWFQSLRDDGDVFLDLPTAPKRSTVDALCLLDVAYEQGGRLCASRNGKGAKILTGRRLQFEAPR